ncbi:hypothetical protein ACFLU6_04785 [Acidobacteriota bacterium]
MIEESIRNAVERIHASSMKTVIYLTGGGSLGLAWILGVPGASRTLLEAAVPYNRASLLSLLEYEPEHFVSMTTAEDLARKALDRAIELGSDPRKTVGIGLTAALITDRPRKGEHRCALAVESTRSSETFSLRLEKEKRTREDEESLVSSLLIKALGRSVDPPVPVKLKLSPGDNLDVRATDQQDAIIRLAGEENARIFMMENGSTTEEDPGITFLLPGSFNPLHRGHAGLMHAAQEMLKGKGAFEISLDNVDKPMLPPGKAKARATVLSRQAPVVLTRAPTFVDKVALFPQTTFVMGYDTARRILDPKYYKEGHSGLSGALECFKEAQATFLVAGRLEEGAFRSLGDLKIPEGGDYLFREIPESVFREDISSTELREGSVPAFKLS